VRFDVTFQLREYPHILLTERVYEGSAAFSKPGIWIVRSRARMTHVARSTGSIVF